MEADLFVLYGIHRFLTGFFPGGAESTSGPFTIGKAEFLQLPDVEAKSWEGMENAIAVCGKMTEASQALFYKFQQDAFEGDMPQLWSFQFHDGKDSVIMRVEDFTVCLCWMSDEMMALMEQRELFPCEELEAVD
jgi:hypothetical protein